MVPSIKMNSLNLLVSVRLVFASWSFCPRTWKATRENTSIRDISPYWGFSLFLE